MDSITQGLNTIAKMLGGGLGGRPIKAIIDSSQQFVVQGAIYNLTAVLADVPGCTMTYTSGATAETLFLVAQAMMISTAGNNAQWQLNVNGTDLTEVGYVDGAVYGTPTRGFTVTVPANTVNTIKFRARGSAAVGSVLNNAAIYMPKVIGIALGQQTLGAGTQLSVTRQDDSANSSLTSPTIQTGWGQGVPGVASILTKAVTFPTAFANKPIVILVPGGDSAATNTYGAGTLAIKRISGEAHTITNTGFTASLYSTDATNWGAGNVVFFQWIAIGS